MNRKAQLSVEYLIIMGFIFAVLVPGVYLFYSYTLGQNDAVTADVVNKIGTDLVNTAESMFRVGEHSWISLDVVFPEQVVDYYILGMRDLVIEYESQEGIQEAVFFSDVDISGGADRDGGMGDPPYDNSDLSSDPHPGLVSLRVESKGDWVLIDVNP